MKPNCAPNCGEFRDAGLGAMAEAEVAALVDGADAQAFNEDGAHKIFAGEACQRSVKGQHEYRIHSGSGEQAEPLGMGVISRGALQRAEKLLGVRIEGDGDGASAEARASATTAERICRWPQMHAIKVADRGHAGAKAGRDLSNGAIDGNQVGGGLTHFSPAGGLRGPRSTGSSRPS